MKDLPRAALLYILTVWAAGAATFLSALLRLASSGPAGSHLFGLALFALLAAFADFKRLRLRSASYSVATATNFACAITLGPAAAICASAIGALAGDLGTRKALHKSLFNAAGVGLSVAAGSSAMEALRLHPGHPTPADLPALGAYALVHALVNQSLVCCVIALTTRTPLLRVVAANFRGLLLPIVALYPLGTLMAVAYASFGQWIGLLLLVLPAVAAYASLDKARKLREANEHLEESARRSAALYAELRTAHEELTVARDEVLSINKRLRGALTELEAAQERVVQQERLRALGQMASGIAHDFNNALAPVVGFSELLLLDRESWRDPEFLAQHLEMINTSARDAASVVRQMREFYRPRDEDELLLPVDLSPLVRQAVEITQGKWKGQPLARGATINVRTELPPLPNVLADEASLREVLTNLIFNAVDAMPDGGTLTLRARTAAGAVVLEVADTGTGMTEEVRRRCLDPFFTTKGQHGTGMGLSMVHGIVQRHGGTLEIESAPGQGTLIRITLPTAPAATDAPGAPAAPDAEPAIPSPQPPLSPEPTAATATATAATRHPLRLLVVDDEPSVRDVLKAYAASCGHVAETASSGPAALRLFETGLFHLVVTDNAMPGMSGEAVAAEIKRLSPETPVIMLTGFAEELRSRGAPPAGVDLVLAKPVLHADFRRAVESLAGASAPSAPSAPSPAGATDPLRVPATVT